MKPTPSLSVRLRFSTKDVGKGFYRGNRTGSMGSHTPKGEYLIDYRKVRNYNVPDLKNFQLTPYVTREIGTKSDIDETLDRTYDEVEKRFLALDLEVARRKRAMGFLNRWKQNNAREFVRYVEHQQGIDAGLDESIERFKEAARQVSKERASDRPL